MVMDSHLFQMSKLLWAITLQESPHSALDLRVDAPLRLSVV